MSTSPRSSATTLPPAEGARRFLTPLRGVTVGGIVVILVILALAAITALQTRTRELDDGRRELATLNTVLAEEASRTVQGVDLVLSNLIDQFAAGGITTAADFRAKTGRDVHDLLRGKLAGLPQLDAISLVASDGTVFNFSRAYPVPAINVSDRDYFPALVKGDDQLFVSTPVENRGTGSWTVYLARRLTGRDGAFLGAVLGAMDLRYFEGFYRSLNLERGLAVSIWRRDGTLLAREPAMAGVGRSYNTPAFQDLSEKNQVFVYESTSVIDGKARLVSRRLVPNYPLVVAVSRTTQQVLGDWRREATVLGVAACLASLAVLVVMAALARQFGAYEALARAVRERELAVTAREEVEAQLRQSQKLELMGQLTSGVAHDFNNYLTVVIGNLQLIGRKLAGRDEAPIEGLVRSALAGAERAAALTKQLLAFSRREPLEPRTVEVNGLIAGMSDILRHTSGDRCRVSLTLAPDLWPTLADETQLETALLNLVVNARDAMPDGGRIQIATRNLPLDGGSPASVEVSVSDGGTGMSPDVLARVFEPFFTTKPAGSGTGLGLAQVYGFARQSQGDVRIDSEMGRGTRVNIVLPRSPEWREPPGDTPAPRFDGPPGTAAAVPRGDAVPSLG